jgi:ParB family chromosome partitioning protein
MSKRRVFDIDFDLNQDSPEDTPAPSDDAPRRGPMATAISENAAALTDRQSAEAAIRAENDRLAHEYISLKKDGAIVARLPIDDVKMTKLTRDRGKGEDPEFNELKTSIREIGLSNPIQVEDTGAGYELIQGYRRLAAFRALFLQSGDPRFATIPAVLVAKGEALENLYRRMVDENLVRRDISFAEMGQLASSYARQTGVPLGDAIATLYASAGRQKRNYISHFSTLMDVIGDKLTYPEAIPRSLGLKLVKAMEDYPRLRRHLEIVLENHQPHNAAAELALLNKALAPKRADDTPRPSTSSKTTIKLNRRTGNVKVTGSRGKIELQMDKDFGAVDARKLEAAVRALLDQLGL